MADEHDAAREHWQRGRTDVPVEYEPNPSLTLSLQSLHDHAFIAGAEWERERSQALLDAAREVVAWESSFRGSDRVAWCGEEYATDELNRYGAQQYETCRDPDHLCGNCVRLNALHAAIETYERASTRVQVDLNEGETNG